MIFPNHETIYFLSLNGALYQFRRNANEFVLGKNDSTNSMKNNIKSKYLTHKKITSKIDMRIGN
jgi:hypothetical protein